MFKRIAFRRIALTLLAIFFSAAAASHAHPGGLDQYGGHFDRKTGEYHYHKGPNAGKTVPASEAPRPMRGRKKSGTASQEAAAPAATGGFDLSSILPYSFKSEGTYQATVTDIIDVNTLQVTLVPKDDIPQRNERVRLVGVAVPDEKEILDHARKTLSGKTVWLQLDSQTRDQDNNVLAYVWLGSLPRNFDNEKTIRDRMFNAQLLLRGYAQAATVYPNTRYSEQFLKFQTEAREKGRGFWKQP